MSATLPAEVLEMTNKFMTDPIRVLVKRDELTLEVRDARGVTSDAGSVPLRRLVMRYAATLSFQ